MGVHFAVLGSLEVHDDDGRALDLSSRRQRRLLAALLVHAGNVVSDERLTDMVWEDEPPPDGGVRSLRTVVSRLRTTLESVEPSRGHLLTKPPGYLLDLNGSSLDATAFETQLERAKRMLVGGDTAGAVSALDEALRMWRGPAYAEFASEEWARAEAVRLEEQRAEAIELRLDARLRAGAHREIIGDLEQLIAMHPYRERPYMLLMLALYRSGRQAEALRTHSTYRTMLADELGLEPSPAMQELEGQILRHDAELEVLIPTPRVRSYELLEHLGSGAWGDVWRARQPVVDREVAIKMIPPRVADDAEFIRRFELEARLIAALEHPHVVPLYDYWRDPSGAYVVMRLLRGGTAAERMKQVGAWPLPAVAVLVDQIGSALDAAHAAGALHRDVKPSNILLDQQGNAYLADFGQARRVVRDGAARTADESAGTLAYAAPELVDGAAIGPEADVFSLAVATWELLCGSHPNTFRRAGEMLGSAGYPSLPSLMVARSGLPVPLDVVLQRAAHSDPSQRYGGVREFVDAFVTAAGGTPQTTISGVETRPDPTPVRAPRVANPYKGLRPFDDVDVADFFGRDDVNRQLLDVLAQHRLLAVVGPSGAGKSSLVRAGLLPALRNGAVAGSREWFVAEMVPGRNPFEELESALLRIAVNPPVSLLAQLDSGPSGIARALRRTVPEGGTVMLVIDQFEELYTQSDPEGAERFMEGLAYALSDPRTSLRVAVTIRADFFDRPLGDPRVSQFLSVATVPVGAMDSDALALAITAPAARVGVAVESAAVHALVADASGRVAALPLLQYLLTELFDRRSGLVMTYESYRELGGMNGVVGQRAEHIYQSLDAAGQRSTRRVFGRLVTLGEGLADTRRRARRAELEAGRDRDAIVDVIDRFGAGRLLVFDRDAGTREPTVEIAHEALLDAWPRLRSWLEEDRDLLRSVTAIAASADAWVRNGRDPGDLLRGARLVDATIVEARAEDRLTDTEREYVALSRTTFEEDQLRQRRQNRRLRVLLSGTVLLLVASLIASVFAVQQRHRADERAADAIASAFGAETERINSLPGQLVPTNRRVALLLAVEAYRREPSPQSLGALQQALVGSETLLGYYGGGTRYDLVEWIDASRFVAAGAHGIDVFTLDDPVPRHLDINAVTAMSADASGEAIAVIRSGSVSIVDLDQGRSRELFRPDDNDAAQTATFSPDGSQVAIGTRRGELVVIDVATADTVVRITAHSEDDVEELAIEDCVERATPHMPGSTRRGVTALEFLDDRELASTGFGAVRIWDRTTGDLVAESVLTARVAEQCVISVPTALGIAGSADARRLIIADRFQAWEFDQDLAAAPRLHELTGRGTYASNVIVDSPVDISDERLAFDLGAGEIRVLDLSDDALPLVHFNSDMPDATELAVSPAGDSLVVASTDGLAVASLDGDGLIGEAFGPVGRGDLSISDDGQFAVSSNLVPQRSKAWRLGDETWTPIDIEIDGMGYLTPDIRRGGLFAVGDTEIVFVDLETGHQTPFTGWDISVTGAFGSPIDTETGLFALVGDDGVYEIRNIVDGSVAFRSVEFQSARPLVPLVFIGPGVDEHTVLVDGTLYVYRTSDGRRLAAYEVGRGSVVQLAYTRDRRHAVTARSDGAITVRDSRDFQPTGITFVGNTAATSGDLGPWFTPDGKVMLTAGDGRGRLWEFSTGTLIGTPFPNDEGWAAGGSANARWLASVVGGRLVRWNLDMSAWPEIACAAAGRNLTESEWREYGPRDLAYRATCPQYEIEHATAPNGQEAT